MWQLWIFSLATSFLLPAMGEVVKSFRPCSQFFLGGKPPTLKPMNPARICQFYQGQYRFATMYDRNGRIPLFSAYKYQPGGSGRRNDWMIEPQLALPRQHSRKSMESERTSKINPELLKNSQAVSEDYKGAPLYDRGHLLPVCHQPDPDSKAATFTLTNVVPQFHLLNNGKWAKYESNMANLTNGCLDTYVLVGVVPGKESLNKRVNIPSHIWAAACCVTKHKQKKSWGVIAENNQGQVVQRSLKQLEMQLAKCYQKKKINLFNGGCYSTNQLHATNTSRVRTQQLTCVTH